LDRHAVEEDRARAAVRRVAADVRAGEPQVLAQEMHEQQPRLDLALRGDAVDVDRDRVLRHGHAPCARATAFARARPVRTRAISVLYSTDPRRSASGDAALAASRAASASVPASGLLPRRNCSASAARTGVGPAFVRPMPARSISPPLPSVTCAADAAVAKSPTFRSSLT